MASGGEDSKNIPKDEQAVINMLKQMGISEYEPGVVNHLMNFAYRYTTDVLQDARVYSGHAKKKTIDKEDVALAIEMKQETSFTSPPSKEVIAEAAAARNAMPLPCVKNSLGLRLPADRYTLTSANYHLKSSAKKKIVQNLPKQIAGGVSPILQKKCAPASFIRTNPAFAHKISTLAAVPVSRPILTVAKPAMKPVLQVTEKATSVSTPAQVEATSRVINVNPKTIARIFPANSSSTSLYTEVPNSTKPSLCDN